MDINQELSNLTLDWLKDQTGIQDETQLGDIDKGFKSFVQQNPARYNTLDDAFQAYVQRQKSAGNWPGETVH